MNSKKNAFAALGLSVALSTTALAAPVTYSPDPLHTFVRFSYVHKGYSIQEARFDKTSGMVTYDATARSGSVDFVIDMKSVNTGTDLFNKAIQGAELFNTADFPTASFKSTSIKFNGDVPVSIEGDLTIKGITKPVTLTVTSFKHGTEFMKKDSIGANATGTIKRSDFKMDQYVPMVGDDVTLSIAIEAAAP